MVYLAYTAFTGSEMLAKRLLHLLARRLLYRLAQSAGTRIARTNRIVARGLVHRHAVGRSAFSAQMSRSPKPDWLDLALLQRVTLCKPERMNLRPGAA